MYEIEKLHQMLTFANIPHTFSQMDANFFGNGAYQIILYADNEQTKMLDDAIFHQYSHGFKEGLLETSVLNNCNGYETADEVFKGWEKMFNKKKR